MSLVDFNNPNLHSLGDCEYEIKDLVIQLHNIARTVEQIYGVCQLSIDTRKLADRYALLVADVLASV